MKLKTGSNLMNTIKSLHVFAILFIFLSLGGCGVPNDAKAPQINEPMFTKIQDGYVRNISNDWFNQIILSGNIDATVTTQKFQNQLLVQGTPNMRRSLTTKIRNHILYISYGNYPANFSASSPIKIELSLHSPIQKITVNGDGTVHLSGDLVLSRIAVTDNALLYAYWIDSTNLHVFAGDNAKLFLGGVATDVDIIARNNAKIDARYLRVKNAYVRTQNNSNVGVKVSNSLSTFSTEASTVYYYGDSDLHLHYLANHGSALRMAGIAN